MKIIIRTICIFLVCLNTQFVQSQNNNTSKLHFELFTITDGISQNNITCIFQDSKGFLWIGTHAGLNRYDGKNFDVYKNDPEDSLSISDNMIFGITEDLHQNIWIATENGLNFFEREKNKFTRFFFTPNNPQKSISENLVYNVLCDNEGNIWIKTPVSFDRINPITFEIKKYKYEINFFIRESDNFSHPIYQDKNGVLWFGSKDGLGYYHADADEIIFIRHDTYTKSSISNNQVRCIFEDSYGNLWIGTSHGLNLLNKQTKQFTNYFYNSSSGKNTINGISQGNGNELWITTLNDGLLQFCNTKKTFIQHKHSSIENSISTNQTNCIIRDRSHILWIGSTNGLNKLDIKPKKFNILPNIQSGTNSYHNNTTSVTSHGNLVFIGTRYDGLYIYNHKDQTSLRYAANLGNYPDNYITAIIKKNDNQLFISGDNSLMVYHIEKKQFQSIYEIIPELKLFETFNKRIRCMLFDSEQKLWLGTSSGIFIYNFSSKKLQHFERTSYRQILLPSNTINVLLEDSKKNIWIGTDKGLSMYNNESKDFSVISYANHSKEIHLQNKIYSLSEDAEQNIWIGTNSGLYKYNPQDTKCDFFTEKNGLPNNQIFSILEYNNAIWVSTNKGLASYIPKTNVIKSFYPSDGIQGYEFSQNAAYKTPQGYMYFGGNQGVNFFHPDSIFDNPIMPNIEILKISYFFNNQKETITIGEKKSITLPWQNNTVTITFASLEFTQPLKNNYKYILEGMDKEWHSIDNQNSINISNLPSGRYVLKVIGSNNDLIWGHERILEIIVTTPIWKTIWAYILYIITFIVLLFLFIESRTKTLKIANKTLTEKQQAALEIAKQKEELALKNKNITDSITYAKRIQWAIMPSRAKFKQLLPNSCILYMPKDIVSGDFYWITEIEDRIFIAAVDCTGHGVPGAFMSIIGYDLLRNITKERKIHKPSEILDYLNKALIELLTKNEMEEDTVKDGMDMSICVFHKSKGILEFAGALNSLYIIRSHKILTIKGDRFPVGLGNEHVDVPYKNHIIKVQKNDTFYMFTDGFADQFGGPHGKKMKFRRFRHIILSVYKLPFAKQVRALKEHFNEWKGELEQIDDVLILGFNLDTYLEKNEKSAE